MKIDIDIREFFSEEKIHEIAKSISFVVRKSPINGFNFLTTFTIGLINTSDATLTQLASFLNATSNIEVSPQAVDERINASAKEFLKVCLIKAINFSMQKITVPNDLISFFSHIYISDSTNFILYPSLKEIFKGSGGDASTASMRIQFIYDYLSGKMYVELGDTHNSDSSTLFDIIENNKLDTNGNTLFIQDLGYFNTKIFMMIDTSNKFFISKLKYKVKVYDLNENEMDLLKILEKNPHTIELEIKVGELKCRLVGSRLPDAIVNERLRKANKEAKKRGRSNTKEYKLFLSFGLFITNLPEQYRPQAIFTIYRIRWQIELIFKSWKSILNIHKIRSSRENRVFCEVYGKLIVAVLLSGICYKLKFFFKKNFSYYKILQYFKSIAFKWALAIMSGELSHLSFMKSLVNSLLRFCRKNKQKNKPTIEDFLYQLPSSNNYSNLIFSSACSGKFLLA